jgi:hypothetical protein
MVALALSAALLAGCTSGGDDDAEEFDADARTAPSPELAVQVADVGFPPLESLSHGEVAHDFCKAVDGALEARGYTWRDSTGYGGDATCTFGTRGLFVVESGSPHLILEIRGVGGEAASAVYEELLDAAVRTAEEEPPDVYKPMRWSGPEEFPVGEEGFLAHGANSERTGLHAAFRSGEVTYALTLQGFITALGNEFREPPPPREDAERELIEVVRALGGDGTGEGRLIADIDFADYPGGLPDLGRPLPPVVDAADGDEKLCASLGELMRPLALVERQTDEGCDLISGRPQSGPTPGTASHRVLLEVERGHPAAKRERALTKVLRVVSGNERLRAGPLYVLPAGSDGFMIFREDVGDGPDADSRLDGGYLIDDEYFVRVYVTAIEFVDDDGRLVRRSLDEEAHVGLLAEVLARLEQAP